MNLLQCSISFNQSTYFDSIAHSHTLLHSSQPISLHKYILPENDFVNCDGQVHDLLCLNGFSGVQVPAGESVSLPGYRDAKGCF